MKRSKYLLNDDNGSFFLSSLSLYFIPSCPTDTQNRYYSDLIIFKLCNLLLLLSEHREIVIESHQCKYSSRSTKEITKFFSCFSLSPCVYVLVLVMTDISIIIIQERPLSHTYTRRTCSTTYKQSIICKIVHVFFAFIARRIVFFFLVVVFFIHFCLSFAAMANSVSIELPWIHWGIFVWNLCFFFSAALLRWKMCSHKRNNRVWNESPIKMGFFVRFNRAQAGEKINVENQYRA